MKHARAFSIQFLRDILAKETINTAAELTYRLMLAILPLMTFLMSLLGFLHLDVTLLDELIAPYLPQDIHTTLLGFINTLALERNVTILSLSIILAISSASSGFRAIMRGINRCYGTRDERNLIVRIIISIALTFVFVTTIIISVVAIVFRGVILEFVSQYAEINIGLTALLSSLVTFCSMFIALTFIYKISVIKKSLRSVLPGSLFSVCLWLATARLFNIYIAIFPVSSVYGSIASAFVMLLWLNMISIIILLGAQLNASLESFKQHTIKPTEG